MQLETLGGQVYCIFAFGGYVFNILRERDVPLSLEMYRSKQYVLEFVGFLQTRGVGR